MIVRLCTTALLAAATIGMVACANGEGPEVATAESPGQPPAASSSEPPDMRQFVACLRERGLDVADPPPGERLRLGSKDDKTQAALRACQRYAPATTQDEEGSIDPASARAYSACVRGKGFPDFPDPDSRGPQFPKNLIDDERFKAADRDCAHHLNDSKGTEK